MNYSKRRETLLSLLISIELLLFFFVLPFINSTPLFSRNNCGFSNAPISIPVSSEGLNDGAQQEGRTVFLSLERGKYVPASSHSQKPLFITQKQDSLFQICDEYVTFEEYSVEVHHTAYHLKAGVYLARVIPKFSVL